MSEKLSQPHKLSWQELGEYRQDQAGKIRELTARFGRVVPVTMVGIPLYLISEPEIIRELLVRHPDELHKDRFTAHVFRRMLGDGLLTAEDAKWSRQRKLIQPIFHAGHIQDFADTFTALAGEMCERWPVGATLQLEKEMMALTLRIICRTMFSEEIAGQIEQLEKHLEVIVAEAQKQLDFGLRIPSWLPLPTYRRQNKAIAGISDLLRQIIQKRQAQLAQGREVPADLLTMLLTARYEDGQPMAEEQVLHECLTIFFAGHETTAVSLTWCWTLLLQHPAILARLTAEVSGVLGDRPVRYDDLAQLPYLSQVIKETLRLYPPAAAIAREVMQPFEAGGFQFKAKETLIVSIDTLHHQADFFPEPDQFNPDRFGPEQAQPGRYTYMPFGAGSRICVGNAFATLEMQMVLATMVQQLQLALLPGQQFGPAQLITLKPQDGVQIKVESKRLA
ncbi:MAG: cytochrome P450 [Ardenticatenales bacterium]|nr:cytochrome P450 [Ardenticatenales bacterium]